jgi:hypothetical protein
MIFRHGDQYRCDVDSGATHSQSATAANRVDISELPNLLRETDQVVSIRGAGPRSPIA